MEKGKYERTKEHKERMSKIIQNLDRKQINNPHWKGGIIKRKINNHFYMWLYQPNHPHAFALNKNGSKYVALHRFLMEQKIGRYLNENELVHHKDGNTLNNNIENLQLVSRGEHNTIHKTKVII